MNNKVTILGVPFSKMTLNETVLLLEEHIQNKESKMFHLITANPEITITCQSDKEFQNIIQKADLITPDGIGIVIAARIRKDPISERVTGFDLLHKLLEKGNEEGWSFYFLGTDENSNAKSVEKIRSMYPNVSIAGRHHGFFTKEEEPLILLEIKKSKPDLLIVAMGAPYSDKWIYKNKQELNKVGVVFGVGGSLDVISGKVKATPEFWKKIKLEWLHRLMTVPAGKGQKSRWLRQSVIPKYIYQAIIQKK